MANYVLGPDDQIIIHAFQAQELSDKPIQVPGDGYISLPMVGRVKAAGLSVRQLEEELVQRLKTYVRDPQVSVFVSDYRSEPVSVVGAVGTPGVVQLRGRKNLVEVIAMAGGLKPEAGNTITITRELAMGRIPLPGAKDGPNGQFSIATVNLRNVMEAHDPQDNILVEANDVIMIPRAQRLYVVGEVMRPGAYELNEKDSVSVLQVVALAGGLSPKASAKKARILYRGSNSANRTETLANVKKILDGQAPDVELHADDILFVPNSLPKTAGSTALSTALNMAGLAVFRIP
jgi:polysaccharide export outer membrane protein